jgi:hypothetical protein
MTNRGKPRDPILETADLEPGAEWLPDGEDDEVTIQLGPGGGAYFTPRALRNLRGPQAEGVEQLQRAARDLFDAHKRLDELVPACRSLGLSWDSIGWCIGLTGATVRQRFRE